MKKIPSINIEEFLKEVSKKKYNSADFAKIKSAFEFSCKAHEGQKRKSGEDYIVHPLNVAHILSSLNLDIDTIISALLHDVVEDTSYNIDEIKNLFGKNVAQIVNGVSKISDFSFDLSVNIEKKQVENFRKLLISLTKDIRVILVKLADRLHNIRTIKYLSPERQKYIASETLYIYAPLANRFGLSFFKMELEDKSFKTLYYSEYSKIKQLVNDNKEEREKYINEAFIPKINELLELNNIYNAKIFGRSKHFYSIYKKHIVRKVPYNKIYDLYAIRVILQTNDQCYAALGYIHAKYKIFSPEMIKDYISRKKPNGYQSLHTTVISDNGNIVEIQIRTEEMHSIAEEGIAAHWRYKEYTKFNKKDLEKEATLAKDQVPNKSNEQIDFIRNFLKDNENVENRDDFFNNLKLDLYPDVIYVFTPKNQIMEFPVNATPIDFAFKIHSQIGIYCCSCKINNVIKPLKTPLKTGDVVEIITSKTPNANLNWLSYVKTSRARNKIKSYLHNIETENAKIIGKQIFEKGIKKYNLNLSIKDIDKINKILAQLKITNLMTFFIKLGNGSLDFLAFVGIYNNFFASKNIKIDYRKNVPLNHFQEQDEGIAKSYLEKIKGVKIGAISDCVISYAKCCNPLPGNEIIGYVSKSKGITIHRKDCSDKNFKKLLQEDDDRLIEVDWDYTLKSHFKNSNCLVNLSIKCVDRNALLISILNAITNKFKLNIETVNTNKIEETNLITINLSLKLKNYSQLQDIIEEVKLTKGILDINEEIK